MKRIGFAFFIVVLSTNLFAQDEGVDRFSFSISWTPALYVASIDDFVMDDVLPLNFETLIHYKPYPKLSFSSGIGYQRYVSTGLSWIYLSHIDTNKSYRWVDNNFRVPINAKYKIFESSANADSYVKAEFINEWMFFKTIQYENEIISSTQSNSWYSPLVGFGIGSMIRKNKPIGILIEGSLETYVREEFFGMHICKMKFGIVFN